MIPSTSPLTDLAAQLGVASSALAAIEGPVSLKHTFPITADCAARLDPQQVEAFVTEYGDAARAEIRTGDLTEIILERGFRAEDVSAFAARAAGGGPYEFWIQVDKDRLAARITGSTPTRNVRLFFFSDALRRALARGLTRFESEVWQHAPAPLIIGVLDTDIDLAGPHLAVLGGASLLGLSYAAAQPTPDTDFASLNEARDRHVSWDAHWTTGLTPWHFNIAGTCDDEKLRGILRAQLVKLAVLFTCDRARSETTTVPPPVIRAEYRGREHVAVVRIDERSPLETTDAETAAVLDAVDWCYRRRGMNEEPDWVSDRLPFLQTRIAQSLEPHAEQNRLGALTRGMPYLLEGIQWHWKAFVEGKVGLYLDQVQQMEAVVADTVTSFADRAAALVKSLGETILAAVAVLIGSSIAAAFRGPFNVTLFRTGLRIYAVYVLLFPGLIGLLASNHGLRVARTTFDARARRFKETLHPDKVDAIIADRVNKAQRGYYLWLAGVAVILVAVSIATWTASTVVPDRILEDSAATEPTTNSVPADQGPTDEQPAPAPTPQQHRSVPR